MNDPRRMLDDGATETERRLLEAGVSEEPSDRSVRAAAAALGLAAGLSAVLPGTAAASAASQVGVATALKWTGLGLLIAGAVSLGAYRMAVSTPPSDPAPPVAPARTAPVDEPATATAAELDDSSADEAAVEPGPAASAAKPVAGSRGRVDAEPSDPAASIREQTAMIDTARKQLRAGNPGGAVTEIDRYHRKFPKGVFGQEAILLRIEALVRSGNRAAARNVARRFLAGKPSSQYVQRIESLVGPMGESAK